MNTNTSRHNLSSLDRYLHDVVQPSFRDVSKLHRKSIHEVKGCPALFSFSCRVPAQLRGSTICTCDTFRKKEKKTGSHHFRSTIRSNLGSRFVELCDVEPTCEKNGVSGGKKTQILGWETIRTFSFRAKRNGSRPPKHRHDAENTRSE